MGISFLTFLFTIKSFIEMKKIVCSLFFALLVVGVVAANGIDVPKKITTTFKAKYPTAEEVIWSMADDIYTAEFVLDGYDAIETFEKNGNWIKTVTELEEDYLPQVILNYLEETYDDRSINYASKVEDKSGVTFMLVLEVTTYDDNDEEVTKGVNLKFDEDGKLIKK